MVRRLPLLSLFVLGCHGGAAATIHDDLTEPQESLAGCATGDVAANLAIVRDLRESYHEMIVCGGLQLNFASAIANVIVNAAIGRGGPPQLAYQGNGTFGTANGMMMIRTRLAGGGDIGFDVLDPQSYLAGISVNPVGVIGAVARGGKPLDLLRHAADAIDIQFRGQGPGVALLGLAANEVRSGHLRIDPKRIADAIASHIELSSRITVDNDQDDTTVHYVLDGKPQSLRAALDDKTIPMELTSIQANRAPTGQSIRVTEWAMQFKGDGDKVLDGTIALDVDGGAFPYTVKFTYPHRMEPDIQLSCRR
jgi:hypothetical protein